MRHAAIRAASTSGLLPAGGVRGGVERAPPNAANGGETLKRPRPADDDPQADGNAAKRHEGAAFPVEALSGEDQAWEVGDLNMDDFLPTGGGGNWLLDEIDDTALNSGTQYLELHDAANEPPSAADLFEQPFPALAPPTDLDLPQLSNNASEEQDVACTPPPASSSVPAPTQKAVAPVVDAAEWRSVPAAAAPKLPPQASPPPDSYSDIQAPDIETHIIQAPSPVHSKPPTPTSGARRILPRDDSKADQAQRNAKPHSRTTSRKRSRNAQSVSSSPPTIAAQPIGIPAVPMAVNPSQMASNFAAAMAATRTSPGAVPHPMAAPLLFAQGLQSLPLATQQQQQPPQSGRATPTPTTTQEATTQGKPSAKFVPVQGGAAGSSASPKTGGNTLPHGSPMVAPAMQPGQQNLMQMDPASLMYMAQQMWHAALAMTGNTQVPQGVPSPTHPPFFSPQPTALNAQPPVYPQAVGGNAGAPNVRPMNDADAANNGRMRPVFITEDGKHVVVEQMAPAKLMGHPVLGRLQLQSKQQGVVEQVRSAQRTNLASPAASAETVKITESEVSPGASGGKDRRKRLVWTPELHDRFVQAISAVGIHQAVPKTLVQIMNVEGLTTEHVKSHLQKYRNSLRKAACEDERNELKDTSMRTLGNARTDGDLRVGREVRVVPCRSLVQPQHPVAPPVQLHPPMSIPSAPVTPTKAAASSSRPMEAAKGGPPVVKKPVLKVEKVDDTQGDTINKDMHATKASTPTEPATNKEGESASTAAGGGAGDGEAGGFSGTPEQMHERTMQLQYQLQVLVHRTVTLQKHLQVTIGKQGDGKAAAGGGGNMEDTSKALEMTRKEMQKEYECSLKQSEKLRQEIGKIQQELGSKKKAEADGAPSGPAEGGPVAER